MERFEHRSGSSRMYANLFSRGADTISKSLLAEFDEEMGSTRKLLERVPEDKFGWKPYEKSFTLGKLASHVAVIPIFPSLLILRQGEKPAEATSKVELLEAFDRNAAAGREALAGASDDHLAKLIPVTSVLSKPLGAILRSKIMNHLIHHRGQLSVYLRLLDVTVPGMYGPSADEKS
jgi:uncharacterized damage-inducible protein DinB